MALATRLTKRLGIAHPLLLAPMGSVSGGALAAAVTSAGGLGLVGGGYGDREWVERQFAAAGNRRVGCGFITWSLARRPEVLDAALAHRPAAVMLSFGDPRPFAKPIKAAGALLICQVQTLAHVADAIAAGAEVIVAQGSEAGGHGSVRATMPFVPQVVDCRWPRGARYVCRRRGRHRRRPRPCRGADAGRRRGPRRHALLRQRRVAGR